MMLACARALARLTGVRTRTAPPRSAADEVAWETLERLARLRIEAVGSATAAGPHDEATPPWEAIEARDAARSRWLAAAAAVALIAAVGVAAVLRSHAGPPAAAQQEASTVAVTLDVDANALSPLNPDAPAAAIVRAPAGARTAILQALREAATLSDEPRTPAQAGDSDRERAKSAASEPTSVAAAIAGSWARSTPASSTGGPLPGAPFWGPANASAAVSVVAGFAPPAAARPSSGAPIAWPASGPISSYFGPTHPLGIDIAVRAGTPLRAAAAGRIAFVGGDPCCSYGYYIDIDHGNGVLTRYGHLIQPSFLRPGQPVRLGDVIGYAGSTGFSTGPHLHFEIRLHGVPVNPLLVLP